MPGFRFPVSVPASLSELFERIRELLPQLELKVLPNRPVGTTETVIAHGLKSTPVFVVTGNPHCIAIVKETRRANGKHIYLKATNACVVNVWTLAIGSLGASIVPDGGYRMPDWDPAGDALGDHKFSIDSADEAADGYDYAETKIVAGSGTSIANITGTHGKALQVSATGDHLVKASDTDGVPGTVMRKTINSPTVERTLTVDGDGVEVVAFNTIAQADPISFASTLYAAHLDDPALFSSVVCAFYKVVGGGANFVVSFNPDYTEWEEIRPGVFKSTLSGQGSIRDYIADGIVPVAGMRVASVNPTEYPMNLAYDEIRTGVYIITNPGYTGTIGEPDYSESYAVLERAPELDASADFASGCVFQVNQGEGAGKYFRMTNTQPIVLGTDELTWEILDTYTATATDNLLTASQLARASETPNTTALVASVGSPSAWLEFPTLAGTPNLDTYKAGRTEVHALARLHISGSAGSSTWLECEVVRDPGGADTVLETITTSPVVSATDVVVTAFVDDATDQDLAGDRIGMRIRARSDSTTPAAIAVTWSDPAHSTRLLTPMSLAVGGTDDHQALTAISRGFAADGAEARAYRHPRRSSAAVPAVPLSLVDGNLTPDPTADIVILSDEVTINRIDSSQWPNGVGFLTLYFTTAGHLANLAGTAGDMKSLDLGNFGGRPTDQVATLDVGSGAVVDLMLLSGSWHLRSYSAGTVTYP